MERMLIAVFDSDEKAYTASRLLEQLNDESVISLHADAIVSRNLAGETTVVRGHYPDPQGTLGGIALGSLLGILGGPVGLAAGAATGFAIGAATDIARTRVDTAFVRDVVEAIEPGKSALVAEIYEESTDAIDTRMTALGGTVFRRALSDVADAKTDREIASIETKFARKEAELAANLARLTSRLRAGLDSLKRKLTGRPIAHGAGEGEQGD